MTDNSDIQMKISWDVFTWNVPKLEEEKKTFGIGK